MPKKLGVLAFSALLFLLSFPARYFGTGGSAPKLGLSDATFVTARAHIGEAFPDFAGVSDDDIVEAWVKEVGDGHEVSVGYRTPTGYWLTVAVIGDDGVSIPERPRLWTGVLLSLYLRKIAAAFLALWALVAFVIPNFFAKKCPDCPSNFLSPAELIFDETTLFPGGFDKHGYDLPPIIQRDWVCPRCGYKKVTFLAEPRRSGGFYSRPVNRRMSLGLLLNPKELDWYDKLVERWVSRREEGEGMRFATQDDWKEFFNELKSLEREEKGPGAKPKP